MTRRRGMKAEDDPNMKALLAPTRRGHARRQDQRLPGAEVMNVTPEENLQMIADSVKLFRSAGGRCVRRGALLRHVPLEPEYAMKTLLAAQEAGASVLCLCDTNGGSMPEFVAEAVTAVRRKTRQDRIHTHNDAALAVANGLAAVRAGADHAQAQSTASASAAEIWTSSRSSPTCG
jgi:2-isopropylmalate synthase